MMPPSGVVVGRAGQVIGSASAVSAGIAESEAQGKKASSFPDALNTHLRCFFDRSPELA
jgi:hypothetical protein